MTSAPRPALQQASLGRQIKTEAEREPLRFRFSPPRATRGKKPRKKAEASRLFPAPRAAKQSGSPPLCSRGSSKWKAAGY